MTPKTKYFKVIAMCGHVGKMNYVPVAFAIKAQSRSDASQIVLRFPRVKKHRKDAIISSEEITRSSYKKLIKANKDFKYLNCKCNRDQACIEDFDNLVQRVEHQPRRKKYEPAKSMKYRKTIYELGGRRNNLTLCYGENY